MKISDTKGLPAQYEKQEAKPAKNGTPAVEMDGLQLSGFSGQLAGLGATLAAEPQFDAGKVEAIKAAIADGRLQINPEAIADKLLANVEQLLKKPH